MAEDTEQLKGAVAVGSTRLVRQIIFDGQEKRQVEHCCNGEVNRVGLIIQRAYRNMVSGDAITSHTPSCAKCGRQLWPNAAGEQQPPRH